MVLEGLKYQLTKDGWKDVQPGMFAGISFDLITSRKKWGASLRVLVKVLQEADEGTMTIWRAHFNELRKRSKGIFIADYFSLCLIFENIEETAIEMFSKDSIASCNSITVRLALSVSFSSKY